MPSVPSGMGGLGGLGGAENGNLKMRQQRRREFEKFRRFSAESAILLHFYISFFRCLWFSAAQEHLSATTLYTHNLTDQTPDLEILHTNMSDP
jgi:hypothetical protein